MEQSLSINCKKTDREKPNYLELDASSLDSRHFYDLVLQMKPSFRSSAVIDEQYNLVVDNSHRQSLTLRDKRAVRALADPIIKIVADNHLEILKSLRIRPFRYGGTNCNCVVFQDGDFFEKHHDLIPYAILPRHYTWVYYYHKEPRGFSGGNLLFFKEERLVEEVSPSAGTLLVFAADIAHAVSTVRVPSGDFADGRFTITGFVCERPSFVYRLFSKAVRTLKRLS
jgi:Rps23 Pro-64 3,4-dihydroxylase Tpa1-like proline 4-hydroxylase